MVRDDILSGAGGGRERLDGRICLTVRRAVTRLTPGGRVEDSIRPLAGCPSPARASAPCLCVRAADVSPAARPSSVDAIPAGPRDLPPIALNTRAQSCGPALFWWRS